MSNVALVSSSLSLSDDVAIESVLTDIPLFCVGIMSIGIFTFLLAMRRVTLLATYLYISSFIGFTAAILDLSQILVRSRSNASIGIGLNTATNFINAREALLALSVGFVYLFLWTLVARCPHEEATTRRQILPMETKVAFSHSASWQRWGYVGIVLRWTSLLASLSIPLLQMIWRIVVSQRQYGNLYVAESTLETTVSAIFILKLLLNLYLAPINTQWRIIQNYIPPVIALIISASLGVGNLVVFAFSETSLGRFLRAVEVYILILYSLITTFRVSLSQLPGGLLRSPYTPNIDTSIPEKLRGLIGPEPAGSLQSSAVVVIGRSDPTIDESWRPSRNSALSKLSAWIVPHRLSQAPSTANQSIWAQDGELGISSDKRSLASVLSTDTANLSNAGKQSGTPSVIVNPTSFIDILDADVNLDPPAPPFRQERPFTDVSLSYYTLDRNTESPNPFPTQETSSTGSDSPIYGLDGIMNRRNHTVDSVAVQPPSTSRHGNSATSFDELLRQQSELDQSIAALRLFSTQSMTIYPGELATPIPQRADTSPSEQVITLPAVRSRNTQTASYLTSKPSSASAHSDFSLSVFPEPPIADLPLTSSVVPEVTVRQELFASRRDLSNGMIPIQIPHIDTPLLPGSPSQIGVSARFNSAGTQYDVTSFIDLTGPMGGYVPPSAFNNAPLSDLKLEDDGTPTTATNISTSQALRPMILPSALMARPLGRATMSSSFEEPQYSPDKYNEDQAPHSRRRPSLNLRPFLIGTSTFPVPSPLSRTMVPLPNRKRWASLSTAGTSQRPAISGPRPSLADGRREQAPGAFERPRPPPLRLQSAVQQ